MYHSISATSHPAQLLLFAVLSQYTKLTQGLDLMKINPFIAMFKASLKQTKKLNTL